MTELKRHQSGAADNSRIDNSNILMFDFDRQTGQTTDLVFDCRAILANEEWERIQDGLFSILKSNAAVILYQIGLEYGLAVGSKARERKQDVRGAIKFLEIYAYVAGWGKFSTSSVVLSNGRLAKPVTVTVENNFFAISKHKKTEGPRCFIIAGLLAGIAEGLLGEGHNCVETMCMADGAKRCEFLITRRK